MLKFLSKDITHNEIDSHYPGIIANLGYKNLKTVRDNMIKSSKFSDEKIKQYAYRPFDNRYIYLHHGDNLLNRSRPDYDSHLENDSEQITLAQTMRRGYDSPYFSRLPIDLHLSDPDADAFLLRLRFKEFEADTEYQYLPNMADFYDDLARTGVLKVPAPKADSPCEPMPKPAPVLARYGAVRGEDGKPNALAWALAEEVFYHALAVLSAPAYRTEHVEYLAEDWPRVPMPTTREALQASATLGRQVAALLDPQAQPDLSGVVGRLVRAGTDEEAGEADLVIGQKPKYVEARAVFVLSDTLELASVPKRVWEFTLGGYPVLKNWVEYRRGRTLSLEDADWLEGIVRRVEGLLELGPQLDGIYARAKAE